MAFIVTVTHNGNEVPLRGSVWAFSMDRAQVFASREEAQAKLDFAKKFMKASIYKKAVIKEVEPKVTSDMQAGLGWKA